MFGFVFVLLVFGVFGVLAFKSYRRLPDGQRAVRIRLGRPVGSAGPGGSVIVLPFIDQLQFISGGDAAFRGKGRARIPGDIEIAPACEGSFTIANPVAAYQSLPDFAAGGMPPVAQLQKYATGALAAVFPQLFEGDDPQSLAEDAVRLTRAWQAAANQQLQPMGLAITELTVTDLGLPPDLSAEWQLRAYQQGQS
jgi:regulator of protease activity HflC (stomatin/prohibitin superfamily)